MGDLKTNISKEFLFTPLKIYVHLQCKKKQNAELC